MVLLPVFLDVPGAWVAVVVPNRLLVVLQVVLLLLLDILHLWEILLRQGILHLREILQGILLLQGLFCWVNRLGEVE